MIDEWKEWLLSSTPGQRAVVPCTSHRVIEAAMQDLVSAMPDIVMNRSKKFAELPGHGVIDFVGPDVERLQGRIWQKAFVSYGPPPYLSKDYLDTLNSRVRKNG